MILWGRLQFPIQFYFKRQKKWVLTVIIESWVPWSSSVQWGTSVGRLGRNRGLMSILRRWMRTSPFYSEARGSKSKEICVIRKLILLFLNFLNMSLTSFSRATRKERKKRKEKSYSWSPFAFRRVELLRHSHTLCVVSTGKKKLKLGLLFVPGRQIPPLDPHENGNNGAIKLGKQTTQASRRCCWPGPQPTVLEEARATSPCTAEGPPFLVAWHLN